ncbi:hypothetical protein Q5Z23_26305 [Pseudomonas aeruginosa]|uniref:hypothetical protein n=1 Tax=Pseudomonas aeruginosa TaxID=287 RepID=UPI002713EBF1|nr:hypothetical protein [Pseudomonas aeruginosa]MDO7893303.1 hypothetical protein [Pseudomonas aeruginosa]MDO7917881.1 hypothetical protein [Pseudomonas aeruginosa]
MDARAGGKEGGQRDASPSGAHGAFSVDIRRKPVENAAFPGTTRPARHASPATRGAFSPTDTGQRQEEAQPLLWSLDEEIQAAVRTPPSTGRMPDDKHDAS